jgi:sigma-B regulation protein RsbU (phosphoserine phosphatase)
MSSAQTIIGGPISGVGSGVFPSLIFVHGSEQRTLYLDHTPFTIGRKMEKDLAVPDPRVSRDHALIISENGKFFVEDQGSKHGTFVNGERVQRKELLRNDRLEFGARDTIYAVFHPQQRTTNTARDFLSQISGMQISEEVTDLEKLTIFLEAARKLNTTGVLDEILLTLLDVTLKLTGSERGYVFLKTPEGKLRLAAGRNARGEILLDDTTISHSILEDALRANSEFLLTDTSRSLDLTGRQSIVAYDLRTVICIPLRKLQVQSKGRSGSKEDAATGEVLGALYVDSRFASKDISKVSGGLLHVIATEAASLIENARLVQAEEESRRYQQELAIAASIQQSLMAVTIPEVPYARLNGKNLSCRDIGGDFYDAVNTDDGLAVVLADVAGKGVSAALLASTLPDIAASANRYLTSKRIGEKYATVIIARLRRDGELEYVNCGHIPPLFVCGDEVIRPSHGNLPIGLMPDVIYESDRHSMHSGDRLVLVTDGVTEAEDAQGEFFDNERLEAAAKKGSMKDIFDAVSQFCAGTPLSDDCTVVEMVYIGE